MADTKTVDSAQSHDSHDGVNYLNETSGLWSWLTTVDHKRIGVMYIYTIIAFFIVGGLFALALRLELMTAEKLLGHHLMDLLAQKENSLMAQQLLRMLNILENQFLNQTLRL